MAARCKIEYEVSVYVPSLKVQRTTLFKSRTNARAFQRKWPGAKLSVVEVCDGLVRRRGKRTF